MVLRSTKQHSCSHYNAICRDWVAKHNRTTRNSVGNSSSKTGWISTPKQKKDDFEALFKRILKRKIKSAKNAKICWQITIAAWLQPLQYDLRDLAAKDNSITQAAAAPSNIHAAIPMRSASTNSRNAWNYAHRNNHCCKTHRRNQTTPAAPAAHTRYLSSPAAATLHGKTQGFVLRLPPHNTRHATFMQPFQCDLQAQIQETHGTTHTGTTIFAKHIEGTKRPQPHPPHTRGTFHRRLQPLYTEKHKVSCSGFLPTTHGMQPSCSHSNAICKHKFKKCMELRTQEQPFLQNT